MDSAARRILAPLLNRTARMLDQAWLEPNHVTATGLLLGVSGAVAAGLQFWSVALVLWLLSRLADGLDGPPARNRAAAGNPISCAGGSRDTSADFVVSG
ncbi:MAG: CDP-alcohol phosphatidyltransferase family protein, partial [Thermomicrobiales bacterium]